MGSPPFCADPLDDSRDDARLNKEARGGATLWDALKREKPGFWRDSSERGARPLRVGRLAPLRG